MNWIRHRRTPLVLGALLLFLIGTRLCHSGILWSDGDYHLAAAMQIHDGKTLYRDLWYDKPPLTALVMDLFGRPTSWQLSLVEAFLVWTACLFAYLTANKLGGRRAGFLAAALLAFYLTFYIPTAVIPIAPDLLMITPHLAAIYFAFAKKPWAAGVAAAIAFWINTKGIFVLVACLAIAPALALPMILGFAIPCLVGTLALVAVGAWNPYLDQVWRWSILYARNSPVEHPWTNAISRTLNLVGFPRSLTIRIRALLSSYQRTELASFRNLDRNLICRSRPGHAVPTALLLPIACSFNHRRGSRVCRRAAPRLDSSRRRHPFSDTADSLRSCVRDPRA